MIQQNIALGGTRIVAGEHQHAAHAVFGGGSGGLPAVVGLGGAVVMTVSASCARASAIRNSSLRVLLPPVARPVWSSRLIHRRGPPKASLRRGMASSGVGR